VKKPVVAFMQGVAASGGYYTSVACEKIVAEPTTITGSIGVLSGWFVVQELLETSWGGCGHVKSGQKKDGPARSESRRRRSLRTCGTASSPLPTRDSCRSWPKAEGTAHSGIRQAAVDGSIYGAQEALDAKLIDEIGYLDRAIDLVKSMCQD